MTINVPADVIEVLTALGDGITRYEHPRFLPSRDLPLGRTLAQSREGELVEVDTATHVRWCTTTFMPACRVLRIAQSGDVLLLVNEWVHVLRRGAERVVPLFQLPSPRATMHDPFVSHDGDYIAVAIQAPSRPIGLPPISGSVPGDESWVGLQHDGVTVEVVERGQRELITPESL